MSKKEDKKEQEFKGPMGVGDSAEDIQNLDIFEFAQGTKEYEMLTKDLKKEELEEVNREAKAVADKYQDVLNVVAEQLSTPEGQKLFMQMLLKRSGG